QAKITFKPESKLSPMTLRSWLPTSASRTEKPIELAALHGENSQQAGGKWVVHLTGWEKALREVQSVTYTLTQASESNQVLVESRQAAIPEFGFEHSYAGPTKVQALVKFKDGKEESLMTFVGQPPRALDYATQAKYW